MKLQSILSVLLLSCMLLFACSDDKYTTNDPNANLDAPSYSDVNDRYQTYHTFWKPNGGWVGDPMPFYENGKYHVVYLHDARDGAPTFHPFAMATTTDFITYEDNGIIIPCGEEGSQENALGTGCVYKFEDTYYAFYTAHNRELNPPEKIFLATSEDLITWTKQPEFSMQAENGYDANDFRDPFVFKEGDEYKMLITTRGYIKEVDDWQAVIAQYKSKDMINWELDDPFYFNGERMLECPDTFIMGDYQYLIYSNWGWDGNPDRKVHYRYRKVGTSEWIVPEQPRLDDIEFYAGKTAGEGNERFIMGWCPTREDFNDDSNYNWAGSLVVHQLTQNEDGTLNVQAPNPLIEKLNKKDLKMVYNQDGKKEGTNNYSLNSGTDDAFILFDREKGLFGVTASIQLNTAKQFGFEFGSGGNRSEVHRLVFDTELNQLRLEKKTNDEVTIRTNRSINLDLESIDITLLVENSVCVIYVNNELALSCRIYQMNYNPWGIFSKDGTVQFNNVSLIK